MLQASDCRVCGGGNFLALTSYPEFESSVVECKTCHLWQAHPLPSEAFLDQFYKNDFGKKLLSLNRKHERGYHRRARHQYHFIQSFVPVRRVENKEYSVLDVGCHAATLLSLFKNKGCKVTGIDPNPRSQYSQSWYGIKVIQKLFEQGIFPDNSFDLILHSHSLEHVRDPKEVLKEFYRILKPGGHVFIEVPNESKEKLMLKKLRPHLYFFTPDTLENVSKAAGFNIVATRVVGVPPYRSMSYYRDNFFQWLKLRCQASYDVYGKLKISNQIPFFGRFFHEDRYFKGYEPKAEMLRTVLRKVV